MAIYDKNPDHLSLAYLWDENPFEHLKPSFAPTTEKERSQLTGPALGQISGVFDSVLNGPLPWRGKHHRAALTLLELEPEVTAVELVPETLSVRINDMRVAFTPAFRIHHRTGTVSMDVLRRNQTQTKIAAWVWPTLQIRHCFETVGSTYVALHELQVYKQPRLQNAQFVMANQAVNPNELAMRVIENLLRCAGRYTVASIAHALPGVDVQATVFAMATRRRLKLNLQATKPDAMEVDLISPRAKTENLPAPATSQSGTVLRIDRS